MQRYVLSLRTWTISVNNPVAQPRGFHWST